MPILDFFFDLSSPYSYLAATRLPALAERTGAEIRWRPMVLYAVFGATGNRMPAESPPKAQWMLGDLGRWSTHYGVPFRMNSRFPVNALQAMRLILVGERHGRAEQVATEAFRRVWAEDRDVTSPDELQQIAAAAGLPGDATAAITDPAIKDALKANTDEAIRRGVFGAPAFLVGDTLFWGNDRLHFVEQALAAAR